MKMYKKIQKSFAKTCSNGEFSLVATFAIEQLKKAHELEVIFFATVHRKRMQERAQ